MVTLRRFVSTWTVCIWLTRLEVYSWMLRFSINNIQILPEYCDDRSCTRILQWSSQLSQRISGFWSKNIGSAWVDERNPAKSRITLFTNFATKSGWIQKVSPYMKTTSKMWMDKERYKLEIVSLLTCGRNFLACQCLEIPCSEHVEYVLSMSGHCQGWHPGIWFL